MKLKVLAVKIPPEMITEIKKYCLKEDMKIQKFVREALQAALDAKSEKSS